MRPVTLVLLRHSKSCANYVRNVAGTDDEEHPLVAASQELRDPALSVVGERMARTYGARLRQRLVAAGVDLDGAVVGSSHLRRAKQTAALLFPNHERQTFPYFTEHGAIPENTPTGMRYRTPDWDDFVRHLASEQGDTFVVVGHGSFLRSQVWPAVTGRRRTKRFANLDGFIVRGMLTGGRLRVDSVREIPYNGTVSPRRPDTCRLPTRHRKLLVTHRNGGSRRRGHNL
jgi:broad specificity phosphatase PhoE